MAADDPASHCVPGDDRAQRGDVRPAGARLRLLHLRHALLRQRRLRAARRGRGGAAAGRPGHRGRGAGPPSPRLRPGPGARATWPAAPPGSARRWRSTARRTAPTSAIRLAAADARRRWRCAALAGEAAADRRGPRVGVSKAADIPWRFWLAQDPTVSVYRPSVPRARARLTSRTSPSRAAPRNLSRPTSTRMSMSVDGPVCEVETVWNMGRTLDLTGVPGTRRVHLAPRGTERRKAGRDPGSHQAACFWSYRACAEPPEAGCWWLESPTVGNLPESFRKRS